MTDKRSDIDITVKTFPLNFLNYSDLSHHQASVDLFSQLHDECHVYLLGELWILYDALRSKFASDGLYNFRKSWRLSYWIHLLHILEVPGSNIYSRDRLKCVKFPSCFLVPLLECQKWCYVTLAWLPNFILVARDTPTT